jgi:hypothetical protein
MCQNGKERSSILQCSVPFGGGMPGTKRRTNLVSNPISDDVPKVEDVSQEERFFSKLRRWLRQYSINAKEEEYLYEVWKQELGTDDESTDHLVRT